jgi:hypothetical protein
MGYTHYWERPEVLPKRKFAAWADDVRRLIGGSGLEGRLAGGDGTGEPEITADRVCLNGAAVFAEDYETFGIERVYPEPYPDAEPRYHHYRDGRRPSRTRKVHDFCKTAREPYDLIVAAALIRLAIHVPRCRVTSDGGTAEWGPALELCEAVYGTGHDFPITLRRDTCQRCGVLATRAGHVAGAWRRLCAPCVDWHGRQPAAVPADTMARSIA